jgi:hypothetical protein
MLINYTKDFHRVEIFNTKLILDLQNCKKVYIQNANIFSNTEHRVISCLTKI